MTTLTPADVAAGSLSAIRILERDGLDYCRGGKRPFGQACLERPGAEGPQVGDRAGERSEIASC
jgi:hypothetical protein